jgi:hypothetical protein
MLAPLRDDAIVGLIGEVVSLRAAIGIPISSTGRAGINNKVHLASFAVHPGIGVEIHAEVKIRRVVGNPEARV